MLCAKLRWKYPVFFQNKRERPTPQLAHISGLKEIKIYSKNSFENWNSCTSAVTADSYNFLSEIFIMWLILFLDEGI